MKQMTTMRSLLMAAALLLGQSAWAQMTPVGTWHTLDDQSGEVKSEVVIEDVQGKLHGRITKLLRKGADQNKRCTECTDERKDKPVLGLEIIRGAQKVPDEAVWNEGKILDPENGKEYTLKLTPVEGGNKLEVRGSILFFGRTQTWTRVR
jgi:uncharacterized protein (DUF2147 family)